MMPAAAARAEVPDGQWQAPDGEDHHTRPPGWDDYAAPEPAPFYVAPEYPLAVEFIPAHPNNFTPDGIVSFDYVVVHTMQGSYGGTISWFQNPNAVVSTQYVMRSSDGEVTQMVLDKDRAYHVGSSNRYALGIEHEGYVEEPLKYYTWNTYSSSALLTRWLAIQHAIPVDRTHIVGHSELPEQTHTDPGNGWNWELYMPLIREVVPPGQIHGVVVDRSRACTLTASIDTALKRTPMASDGADLCTVPAGAALAYWHARRDIDGHHRLIMPPGEGPCAGINGLDADAYIVAADWSALCPDDAIAAAGVTVQIDGAGPIVSGPDGSFVFTAGVGAHTIDALADDAFEAASEVVDLAGYPGTRVVIAVDPIPVPDPTGDPTGDPGDSDSGGEDSSEDGGEAGPTGAGDGGDGGEAGASSGSPPGDSSGGAPTEGDPTQPLDPALPGGYGQDDGGGCGCRGGSTPAGTGLLLLGLIALRRRRRA